MSMKESEAISPLAGDRRSISYELKPVEREQNDNVLLKSFGQIEGKKF